MSTMQLRDLPRAIAEASAQPFRPGERVTTPWGKGVVITGDGKPRVQLARPYEIRPGLSTNVAIFDQIELRRIA